MSEQQMQAGATRILYDPAALDVVSPEWLHPEFWRLRGAVIAALGGRGQALAVQTDTGPAVLRRYRRGGQVARISRRHFVFTGFNRSRSFREWRVLKELNRRGLPVPAPLLAGCHRRGPVCTAAILTAWIPDTHNLATVHGQLDEADWTRLGATLARFFAAGVRHRDLNAGNILRDGQGNWYLIDFDRATIADRPVSPRPMLRRLLRSLDKLGIRGRREQLLEAAQPE